MIGRKKAIDRIKICKFNEGDLVRFINYEGLPKDIILLLEEQDHKIKHIYSKRTEPILILEPVKGEVLKLGYDEYPFMSDRVIKISNGN